jgi:hypothetical protein
LSGSGGGRIQSLILAAILALSAVAVFVAGILSDLIATNRVLLEELRTRLLVSEINAKAQCAQAVPDVMSRVASPHK